MTENPLECTFLPRLQGWLVMVACVAAAVTHAADPKNDAGGHKPLSPADEATLAGHLQRAFEDGYIVGPKRLQAAQKHLALARRTAPGDPRTDYAHGLVLLKQSQIKPAVAQFETALRQDGGRYWPAWQAAIWGHLVDKQYEAGLKQLDEYAEAVQAAEKRDEVSEAQRDAAGWIGQLIEALAHCTDSQKMHDLVAGHAAHLLEIFGDELSAALEAGRESIRNREFDLEQAAGSARQAADRDRERRKQDKNARLEKDLEGLDKAKDNAKKSAEEWKAWLDDTLARADKQLGLLERDYNFFDQRAQSLSQSITLVGREITNIQVGMSFMNPKNSNTTDPTGTAQLNSQFVLQQRQNQMFGYQMDYNATVGRLQDVAQRGAQAMQERAAAIQRYETATGQLVKKNADLDKWSGRLKNQKQKLTVQKPAAKGGRKAPADKKQQFTLKHYLPLDFDVEKQRVLASFGDLKKVPPE